MARLLKNPWVLCALCWLGMIAGIALGAVSLEMPHSDLSVLIGLSGALIFVAGKIGAFCLMEMD